MPRYELLQDLPGCKKGKIGRPNGGSHYFFGDNSMNCYHENEVDACPDWFRRLPDEPPKPVVECWRWINKDRMDHWASHVKTREGCVIDVILFGDGDTQAWIRTGNARRFGEFPNHWASCTPAEYDAAKQAAEAKRVEASKKPTTEDKGRGLYGKYHIRHADGTPCDSTAKYFVLRLDYHDGCDVKHVDACRAAAWVYAEKIEDSLPVLSRDLKAMLTPEDGAEASKPKVERCEVFTFCGFLRFEKSGKNWNLHEAQDWPTFAGYEYEGGRVYAQVIMWRDASGTHFGSPDGYPVRKPVRPVAVLFAGKE